MELTSFTDYSLRILIYLADDTERLSSIDELAEFYQLSRHHVAKIVKRLADLEYLETIRGKNGGLRLAKDPVEINVATVIKQTEPHFNLVECMCEGKTSACVIHGHCRLKGALATARGHFFTHLAKFSLADVAMSKKESSNLGIR
ncbi:MAG: Rrf2 family transcriptional regulator [Coraliomargarita sp.]